MTVRAPVYDIQRFSIHDGPGIRTLVFLKGCNLHCPWCQNPESQDSKPTIAFYRDRCSQNFDCLRICREGAIHREGFRLDYDACSNCGDCITACAHAALKVIGEQLHPTDLFERIKQDLPYYRESGGGVTFTGGEPTLYPEFVDRVVDLCNGENIHTNIETAGCFSFEKWAPILEKFDLIYFDLKLIDREQFAELAGSGYDIILNNAGLLKEQGYPVEYRLPLIPGITDTTRNLEGIAAFLKSIGVDNVHLLDYHNFGETKIDLIDSGQVKLGLASYTEPERHKVIVSLNQAGMSVVGESCQLQPFCTEEK